MGKSLQVKVKTSVLVKALEEAQVVREKRYANQEQEQAKYEKAVEAYNLAVLKLIKAGKGTVEEASRNEWHERHNKTKGKTAFSVTLLLPSGSLPDEPKQPEAYAKWTYERDLEEIGNAIRVLKLTDQEFVNASTMASVSKFL